MQRVKSTNLRSNLPICTRLCSEPRVDVITRTLPFQPNSSRHQMDRLGASDVSSQETKDPKSKWQPTTRTGNFMEMENVHSTRKPLADIYDVCLASHHNITRLLSQIHTMNVRFSRNVYSTRVNIIILEISATSEIRHSKSSYHIMCEPTRQL